MQTKLESIKETFSQSILGVVIGLIAMRIMLSLLEKTRCKTALQNVEGKKRGNKL
jgi:hypothetical protein